jgi:hypothetical protein
MSAPTKTRRQGDYVNGSEVSVTTGVVPGSNGGYFPPLILELFNSMVCSLIESFSSGRIGKLLDARFRADRDSEAFRTGALDLDWGVEEGVY